MRMDSDIGKAGVVFTVTVYCFLLISVVPWWWREL